LSIEQTLKTYEEIWLSKVFEFETYNDHRSESLAKSTNDEEVIIKFKKIPTRSYYAK
jgi:hypothetical protein